MAPRFDLVKFNLMRALEMFQDLNHDDMDVSAPSSYNYEKEVQLAHKLNDYLGQLIEDGFFEDCELRDSVQSSSDSSSEEDGQENEDEENHDEQDSDSAHSYDSERTTPRSAGFDYSSRSESNNSDRGSASGGSRASFGDRFKRYIKRIMPGSRSRSK